MNNTTYVDTAGRVRDNSHLTSKQYAILTVVCDGCGTNDKGELIPIDMDELLDRLAYKTTKYSMQFSIRALVKRQLITKGTDTRRGQRRVVYLPTEMAKRIMGRHHNPNSDEFSLAELYDL